MNDPGFGELGDGGNRPSGIYLGFYNKLDLVNRYIDGKDSDRMERMAGAIDPLTATVNQFNPVTMIATAMQNVRVASEVYGTGEGYMWEAQVLGAVKTPLRIAGSMLVAAGTAVMAAAGWTGIGALIGGAVALGGAVVSATANSIHVDAKSGKRSYQMTDEGALATLTDVVGGALGGYATYAARASNTAAAAVQAADTTAKLVAASEKAVAAAVTAQTAQSVALGSSAAMGILQAGAEFDSRGRFTGQWSLEGSRGDSALIGAGITFVAAGTAGAAGLKQGTLASDLTKSGVSTGMNMMLQYQKMLAGHENSYAAMAESDFSDLGGILGTVMQSQSQDWQDQLANSLDRTHRASDSMAGLGVFARRDDEGNMRLDGAAQPAGSAWGRFWEGGMSTLAGYGVLAGVIGDGIGAVWDGLKYGYNKVSGWIGDGLDWAAHRSDALGKAYDDWQDRRAMKDVEEEKALFQALATKNEAIARKLNTVEGYNELAEKIYAKQKKDHPDWTYDQHLDAIKLRIDEMKAALINNIAAEDVYINYHQDDVEKLDKYERLIFEAQKEAMQRSMAAFGMERLSREELKEMGFALNDKDKFSEFETKDGMQSWLYRIPGNSWRKTQYILAFRGTEPSEWGDIAADLGTTGMGVRTAQYTQARDLALNAARLVGDKGELSFTGHSLGGGLASLAASVTNKNAITFNAAGVQSTAYSVYGGSTEGIEQRVKAYYLNGDALSAVQDNPIFDPFATLLTPIKYATNWSQGEAVILPAYLPSATGERRQLMAMTGGEVRSNIFQRFLRWGALHSNTNVMTSLQRELQ